MNTQFQLKTRASSTQKQNPNSIPEQTSYAIKLQIKSIEHSLSAPQTPEIFGITLTELNAIMQDVSEEERHSSKELHDLAKHIINREYSKKTGELSFNLNSFAYDKNNLMIELIKITKTQSKLPILTIHMLLKNENAVEIYEKKTHHFGPTITYTYFNGIKFPGFYKDGEIEYARNAIFESDFFTIQYEKCAIRKKNRTVGQQIINTKQNKETQINKASSEYKLGIIKLIKAQKESKLQETLITTETNTHVQLAVAHICFIIKNQNLSIKINNQAQLMGELIAAFKLVFFKTKREEEINDDLFNQFLCDYEKTPILRAIIHESNIVDIKFDWLFYNCLNQSQKFKLIKFLQTTKLDDWQKIRLSYVFFYDDTPWKFIDALNPILNEQTPPLHTKNEILNKKTYLGFTLINYLDPIIKIIYRDARTHLKLIQTEQKIPLKLFFDLIAPEKIINPINGEFEFIQQCKVPFPGPIITSCLNNLFSFINSKIHELYGISININESWEKFKKTMPFEISTWTTQNNELIEYFIKFFDEQLKLKSTKQTNVDIVTKIVSKTLLSKPDIITADFIYSKTSKQSYPTFQVYPSEKIKLIVGLFLDTHIPEFFDLICQNINDLFQLTPEKRNELFIHLTFEQTKILLSLNSNLIEMPELINNFPEKKMHLNCYTIYLHHLILEQTPLPKLIHKETYLFFSLLSLIKTNKSKKHDIESQEKLQKHLNSLTINDEITLLNDIKEFGKHLPKAKINYLKNAILPLIKVHHFGKKILNYIQRQQQQQTFIAKLQGRHQIKTLLIASLQTKKWQEKKQALQTIQKHTKVHETPNKFNAAKQIYARIVTKHKYSQWITQKNKVQIMQTHIRRQNQRQPFIATLQGSHQIKTLLIASLQTKKWIEKKQALQTIQKHIKVHKTPNKFNAAKQIYAIIVTKNKCNQWTDLKNKGQIIQAFIKRQTQRQSFIATLQGSHQIKTFLIASLQTKKWIEKKQALQTIQKSIKRSAQYIQTFITPLKESIRDGVVLSTMEYPPHIKQFLFDLITCKSSGFPELKEKILFDLNKQHLVFLQGSFLYSEHVEDIDFLSIREPIWQQYPKTIGRNLQTSIVIQFGINEKNKLIYKFVCFSPITYALIKKNKITSLSQIPKYPNIQMNDSPSGILNKVKSHINKSALETQNKQLFLYQAVKQLQHTIRLGLKTTNQQYEFINTNKSSLSIILNKNQIKIDYITPEINQMCQKKLSQDVLLQKIERMYLTHVNLK